MTKNILLLASIFSIVGCQSLSRQPASHTPELENEARAAYSTQNNLNRLEDEERRLKSLFDGEKGPRSTSRYSPKTQEAIRKIEKEINSVEKTLNQNLRGLTQHTSSSSEPVLSKLAMSDLWRVQTEEFNLLELKSYELVNSKPRRTYFMATQNTRLYVLDLSQTVTDEKSSLQSEITCDKPFNLITGNGEKSTPAGEVTEFTWKHKSKNSKLRIRVSDPQTHCEMKFRDPAQSQTWAGVRLAPETEQYGDLVHLTREFHLCSLPNTEKLTGPEKFFLTHNYSSITCPEPSDIKVLGAPIEGLTERIKVLTGWDIPQSVIDKRDPYVEIDFSRAPKLDVIVVSSLVFRSDFFGHLLARALVWHAQRGTVVRVITSKVLELSKDRKMFAYMTNASDNIKIQSYAFKSFTGTLKSKINQLHRVSHTKIFATYSRTQPEASVVILGGRNVHEGYILPVAVDRMGFPDLVDYVKGEDAFLYYRDVEALITSREVADSIISHYLTYWHRQPNAFTRSVSLNVETTQSASSAYFAKANQLPLVRHILSLPYKDQRELQDVYADLIDSAEKEIKITTPYFFPTKSVGRALERAVKRGVKVIVITKTDLRGDNPDFEFLSMAANQISINRYWDQFEIYDYQVEKSLLHSKLILIDGKLSIIGSINLNRRSFYHDVENGLMVYSPAFNQQLSQLFDEFTSLCAKVEGERRVGFFKRLLVGIINKEL